MRQRFRSALLWTGVTAAGIAMLAGGYLAARTVAGVQYQASFGAHEHLVTIREPLLTELAELTSTASDTSARLRPVIEHPVAGEFAAERTELEQAVEVLGSRSTELTLPAFPQPAESPRLDENPWPWDVTWGAIQINTLTAQIRDQVQAERSQIELTGSAVERAVFAGAALFTAVAARAEQTMTDSAMATHRTRAELAWVIGRARGELLTDDTSGLLEHVRTAEAAVRDTHRAGLERSEDPRFAVQREIEEYARSVANGLPVDFEWASVVGGYGGNYLSGTAQWDDQNFTWALITLNFTVEDEWTGAGEFDARALVTHEVGHIQVMREQCRSLLTNPVFGGDHEVWATAWAIGMGFDTAGAGIEAYGRPSVEQIELSRGCR